MKIRAFITHKKAEHFQDCQDRFSVNCDTKSLALSDGMSQSIFQTIWAEILVNAYTQNDSWNPNAEKDLCTVKKILAEEWKTRVQNHIQQMQKLGRNTTRAENSLALGLAAGATLVGIRFDGDEWHGDVLGDSCLIEIQDSKIKNIYTSQDSETFDNNPDYYDSNPVKDGKGEAKPIHGKLSSGMTILLVSDPFSDFLSKQRMQETEPQFVKEILDLHTHDDFENLVSRWCSEYGMHNDDSTLIIIEYDGKDDFCIEHKDDIEQKIKEETHVDGNPDGGTDSQKEEDVCTGCIKIEELRKNCEEEKHNIMVEKAMSDERRLTEECNSLKKKISALMEEIAKQKEENERLHCDIESLQGECAKMKSNSEKKDLEITSLHEIISKLEEQLKIKKEQAASKLKVVERSEIRQFCIEEYNSFLHRHRFWSIFPPFNQIEVIHRIINQLFEGPYLIIKQ